MARRRFGADLTAVAWTTQTVDTVDNVVLLAPNATDITAWDLSAGGTQITDLQDLAGVALPSGVITADGNGLFSFLGPDTTPDTAELWLDTGIGPRQLVTANDQFTDIAQAKADAAAALSQVTGIEAAANAYTDAQLADVPHFIVYSSGWVARPINSRMVVFSGGLTPTDAPTDVNLVAGDLWVPEGSG